MPMQSRRSLTPFSNRKYRGGNQCHSQNISVLLPEENIFWKWNSTQNLSVEYQTIVPVGLKEGCRKSAVCSFTKNSRYNGSPQNWFTTLAVCCSSLPVQVQDSRCRVERPAHRSRDCTTDWKPNFSPCTLTPHDSTYLCLISCYCPKQLHSSTEHALSCLFKRVALQILDHISHLLLSRLSAFIVSPFGQKHLQNWM